MPFAKNYSSVPFCDPSLPHHDHHYTAHPVFVLPHRACHHRQTRTPSSSTPWTPISGSGIVSSPLPRWNPAQARELEQKSPPRDLTIAHPPRLQAPPQVKAPPSTPCQRRISAIAFSPLTSSIGIAGTPRISGRQTRDAVRSPCPVPEEKAALSGAELPREFADSPVLGYEHRFHKHHRNASASVPAYDGGTRVQQLATRPRVASSSPCNKPLQSSPTDSSSEAMRPRLAPPPPLDTPFAHAGSRQTRRLQDHAPRPTPLRLFPQPTSPTHSLESKWTIVSSPTSLRPSLYLQPQVSVFEDDEEKLGLLEYLKWPLKGRDMRRGWKAFVCCDRDDD